MNTSPEIIICSNDYERLKTTISRQPTGHDINLLIDELDRAEILPTKDIPKDVVRMHSQVTFTVSATGKTFTARLVYPDERHFDRSISILSPVGSALLGLTVGQCIEWPLSNGTKIKVKIKKVHNDEIKLSL